MCTYVLFISYMKKDVIRQLKTWGVLYKCFQLSRKNGAQYVSLSAANILC